MTDVWKLLYYTLSLLLWWRFPQKQISAIPMTSPLPELVTSSEFNGTTSSRTMIKILASTMYSGMYPIGPITSVVATFALDRLRALPNWLPNYEIAFEVYDDMSDDVAVISGLMAKLLKNDEVDDRFPLMAVTDCSQVGIVMSALIMKPFNFIGFNAFPSEGRFFFNRAKYPNYYTLGERTDYYCISVAKFLSRMNWSKVTIISDMMPFNNMLDRLLVDRLEEDNITLLYMAKIREFTEDEYELSTTFEEMALREPRIFLIEAFSTVTLSCYFHRYNMYGPNYVLFMLSWNIFDENAEIPAFLSSWCKREMLLDILASVIVYGDTTLDDIYGPNVTDLTGVKPGQLFEIVQNSVDHPELAIGWQYWAPVYYDRYLALGIILNETEAILNQENMTLTEWTTNSQNFQKNGDKIVAVIKQAISKLSIVGLKGDYSFDSKTGWTSGSMPIPFKQLVVENLVSHGNVVGYYKSNRKADPLVMHWNQFTWHTVDKKPPADAVKIVTLEIPLIPEAANVVLKTISSLEALTICTLLIYETWAKALLKIDLLMFVGEFLMITAVFVIPVESTPLIYKHCTEFCLLTLIGFALLIAASSQKLRFFSMNKIRSRDSERTVRTSNAVFSFRSNTKAPVRNSRTLSARPSVPVPIPIPYRLPVTNSNYKSKMNSIFWIACSVVEIVAFGLVFANSPIATRKVNMGMVMSNTRSDVAYEQGRFECAVFESISNSNTSVVLMAITVALQLVTLMEATYKSVVVQSFSLAQQTSSETKRLPMFIYCTIVIMFASGFIGILQPGNGQYLTILVSCFALIISALNIGLVAIPNMIEVWKRKMDHQIQADDNANTGNNIKNMSTNRTLTAQTATSATKSHTSSNF